MRWLDGIIDLMDMSLGKVVLKIAPGDSEGQGSLASCSPWGHKELDTTEQLNNNCLPEFHPEERHFLYNIGQ